MIGGCCVGLLIRVAPDEEPVTLAEAKANSRVDTDDEDSLFSAWIATARELIEKRLGRQFVTAEFTLSLDRFPCARGGLIELPAGPLQTIDEIRYVDGDGDEQTLDDALYEFDAVTQPGRLLPVDGESWPDTAAKLAAVEIDFTAGYGDAAAVPARIKQAILLLVNHWYENRGAVGRIGEAIAFSVDALIGSEWDGRLRLAGVDE